MKTEIIGIQRYPSPDGKANNSRARGGPAGGPPNNDRSSGGPPNNDRAAGSRVNDLRAAGVRVNDGRVNDSRVNDSRVNNGRGNDGRAAARRKGADPAQLYSKIVERYAMFFDRPEARLRFLNNTITKQVERQAQLRQSLGRFQFLERTRFYDWIFEARCYSAILEEIRVLARTLPPEKRDLAQRIQAPFSARLFYLFHQSRHAFYGASVFVAGLLLFSLYSVVTWSAHSVKSYLAERYAKRTQIFVTTSTPAPNEVLKALPASKPENIFLVKNKDGAEKWSNGCIILTEYETDNHPRAYYTIPRGSASDGVTVSDKIVGIVYHTPESGIIPFVLDNNETIQKKSRQLLDYVRDHKSYNYVIDRYGDIYRIVRDNQAADHAGYSLWADANNTYVSLNESFLGVCFESKFDGTTSLSEILTEAQILSGRALTAVLRSQYNIDDANCTTHGLVAIDPDKMLIARHHDWVRDFPFETMGLSDKYKIQPPAMIDYGFTFDDHVLEKLNHNLWPGAVAADQEFKRRAGEARVNPDDLRRKLRERYVSQYDKTRRLRDAPGDTGAPQLAERPGGSGESTASGNN